MLFDLRDEEIGEERGKKERRLGEREEEMGKRKRGMGKEAEE